jgi:outer membrane lipoprotein SlyB
MRTLAVILLAALAVAGCRTTVEGDARVRVRADEDRPVVGGTYGPIRCPPGLAMQGRC